MERKLELRVVLDWGSGLVQTRSVDVLNKTPRQTYDAALDLTEEALTEALAKIPNE